jgi:hypothetical protein
VSVSASANLVGLRVTLVDWLGVRVREKEKVPLRVKGLVIKVSMRVEVSFEGEVGYASRWVGSGEGGMSTGIG